MTSGDRCRTHEREALFYCREAHCQKPICGKCVTETSEHKYHDFVEITDEKERLRKDIAMGMDPLVKIREKIAFLKTKQEIGRHNATCLEDLKNSEEEIVSKIKERFSEIVQMVRKHTHNVNSCIEEEITAIDKRLSEVERIGKFTKKNATLLDLKESLNLVPSIKNEIKKERRRLRMYNYFTYDVNKSIKHAEIFCGHVNAQQLFRLVQNAGQQAVVRTAPPKRQMITPLLSKQDNDEPPVKRAANNSRKCKKTGLKMTVMDPSSAREIWNREEAKENILENVEHPLKSKIYPEMESKASCDQDGDRSRAEDTNEKYMKDVTENDDEVDCLANSAVTNKEKEETEILRTISQNNGVVYNKQCVGNPSEGISDEPSQRKIDPIVNEVQIATIRDQAKNNSHTDAVEKKGRENCDSKIIISTSSADEENETFYILSNDPKLEAFLLEEPASLLSNDPKLEAFLLEEPASHKIEVLEIPSKIVSDEQLTRKICLTASDMETDSSRDCIEDDNRKGIEENDTREDLSNDRKTGDFERSNFRNSKAEQLVSFSLSQNQNLILTPPFSPGVTYRIARTFKTKFKDISNIVPLPDGNVVATGSTAGTTLSELVKYSMETGEELWKSGLRKIVWGIAVTKLDGNPCLAWSNESGLQIKFRDLNNLMEEVHAYSVDPGWPSSLCSILPDTLAFVDDSTSVREVMLLNCSTKRSYCFYSFPTQKMDIWDMCSVHSGNDQLLVITGGNATADSVSLVNLANLVKSSRMNGQLCAYNIKTGEMVWAVNGKQPGTNKDICGVAVTSDGNGHLFVCDTNNNCVQMFSADGSDQGRLEIEDKETLGKLKTIRWCSSSSSLIVVHSRDGQYDNVSSVKLRR